MNYLKEFRARGLSVLKFYNEIKEHVGIEVSHRTVAKYFDNDFRTCQDDRILKAARLAISNHDQLIEKFKNL